MADYTIAERYTLPSHGLLYDKEINPEIKPFPSAGISKGEDCYNIIKAGASASGCSSAIAKAAEPLKLAEEMIAAVRRAYDERVGK